MAYTVSFYSSWVSQFKIVTAFDLFLLTILCYLYVPTLSIVQYSTVQYVIFVAVTLDERACTM